MIPVLYASGHGLGEAWENSLIELFKNGGRRETEYDKPGDPLSVDATMIVTIEDPMAEPMIHKDFPGGPEDLQEYVLEVVEGIKNHLVRPAGSAGEEGDTRWEYTYNQRLFEYKQLALVSAHAGNGEWEPERAEVCTINQIEAMAHKLAQTPHTRRAQAITWNVMEDTRCYDPACLQSIWCRITDEEGVWHLNTNIRIRSNDAYKAAFMNMFAFIMLQRHIADLVAREAGREVRLGRYCHMADSYHIYGSYLKEFEGRFLGALKKRTFEQRTVPYTGEWKEMMDEAIPALRAKAATMGRR